jgi:hypothetical protein
MKCPHCDKAHTNNTWKCAKCGKNIEGGVVFVTGISGSGTYEKLEEVASEVVKCGGDGHPVKVHDVGSLMRKHAYQDDPNVGWDRILDASPRVLRLLRALAFQEISSEVASSPDILHMIDLHLCFRWKAYLTKGFEPSIINFFIPRVRCFINVVEDLATIQERLDHTAWGKREILELLVWRDEELLLTDMFAGVCGHVDAFAVASGEPPSVIERLIWHPEQRKVYLSFPITAIKDEKGLLEEISGFRDRLREFLVVFDPYACRDYDETYRRQEMLALRKEVGQTTVDRDFRFIDQADAVVVYYPKKVPSKGVDSEMRHAVEIGKPIFLYCPEDLGGGPFQPAADCIESDPKKFLNLLKEKLGPGGKGGHYV